MLFDLDVVNDELVHERMEDARPFEIQLQAFQIGEPSFVRILGALAFLELPVGERRPRVHDARNDEGRDADVVDVKEKHFRILQGNSPYGSIS